MIYLTDQDKEKIKLIDKFIRAITTADLETLVEADLIAGKLRTLVDEPGPLRALIDSFGILQSEVMQARNENQLLKMDIQTLLKALDQTVFAPPPRYNQDFTSLKNRHGIY